MIGNFSHPAQIFKCRHCGANAGNDPEMCWFCGPLCGNCFASIEPCKRELEARAKQLEKSANATKAKT